MRGSRFPGFSPGSPGSPGRRTVLRAGAAGAAATVAGPLLTASASQEAARGGGSGLQRAFEDAAARHGVPVSVLLAVSHAQSRWDGHGGAASVAGGYGPMHLTDAAHALATSAARPHGDVAALRGDTARPRAGRRAGGVTAAASTADAVGTADVVGTVGTVDAPSFQTLRRAASLTGLAPGDLRTSTAANVQGGAALLAQAQRELGRPLSEDPADWFGAVAAYAHTDSRRAAEVFAHDVYAVMATGAERVTDEGHRVVLTPTPTPTSESLTSLTAAAAEAGDRDRDPNVEAPRSVSCEWIPAPYEDLGDGDYGNHDKADRPYSQSIDYIVIHDTEATWETTLELVQDPTYVSWHYSLRSSDGHIAQHLATKDVGWHAGNWFVNAKSIGLEHEGFLTEPDAWYTEAMYRASARLVRYLADRFGIPLDRHHVLGHDQVQGPVTSSISGMHTDPGPYWDWQHYFELLGAPFDRSEGTGRGLVTIAPDYDTNTPEFDGCDTDSGACEPHGSAAIRLHAAPDQDAALVRDIGTHPDSDGESTSGVNDVGARATAGQQFAAAGREGEWTAIWYLGQQAWFHDPPGAGRAAVRAPGEVVTGKPGADTIPVYGRAYPEASAYPEGVPVQSVSPLVYEIPAGQEYAVGLRTASEYYYAVTYDTATGHQVVRGEDYVQIQLGHRVAYVRAADVEIRRAR